MEEEQKDCSLKVDRLVEKHSWIASEKQLFGRSGSDYDFSSRDPIRAREELERLQGEQSRWNRDLIYNSLCFSIDCFIKGNIFIVTSFPFSV